MRSVGLEERAGGGSRSSTVAYSYPLEYAVSCEGVSLGKLTPRYLLAHDDLKRVACTDVSAAEAAVIELEIPVGMAENIVISLLQLYLRTAWTVIIIGGTWISTKY